LLAGSAAQAQMIDQAVLHSTVLISWDMDASEAQQGAGGRPTGPAVSRGTGFLLFEDLGYTKGKVFLITNRHNLPPEGKPRDIRVRVVVRDSDGSSRVEEVGVPVVGPNGRYLSTVRVHPNPDTDVAAINIATTAFASKFEVLVDAIRTGKRLDTSMLMPTQKLGAADIGLGSQVYVLGFPAALFDPRNVSPVLRVGVISTDPGNGYTFSQDLRKATGLPGHVDGFLIDSNVYPGSSGSLVIAVPEAQNEKSSPEKPGDKHIGNNLSWRPRIVGIVAGSIPLFDAPLRSYERIGLGIVYSADTIREVIRLFDGEVTSQR